MTEPLITHLGGEHCVTGSCHLLRANGLAILVDCGLAQGSDSAIPFAEWPVRPADLDYLFLTHAHIDHIGRLPELIAASFGGEILCSHPTKALLEPMLHDAMGFSGIDGDQKKKILGLIDKLSWGFEYQQRFQLKNGVSFTLGRAGHILGSCFIHFTVAGSECSPRKQSFSVVFSGDVGNFGTPLLRDPEPLPACDLLVLESTYGNRLHEGRRQRLQHLEKVLRRALRDRGKILIPAFALGRTQEILYELDRLFEKPAFRGSLAKLGTRNLPVVIDSPLGVKLTEVYASQSGYWDREARDLLSNGDNPIDFQQLYSSVKFHNHQQLVDMQGPVIILAGSGMCSGGRIIDHLAASLADPGTDILFVGYQAKGTLGRKIIEQGGRSTGSVHINGREIAMRAAVHNLAGYSAHADQLGLLDWVASMPGKPGAIKLVHGEEEAQLALAEKLRAQGQKVHAIKGWKTPLPQNEKK